MDERERAMTRDRDKRPDAAATGSALLSRKQASDELGVSTRTFDHIQREARIPFVMIGKRKKYLKRDIDVYIMGQRRV